MRLAFYKPDSRNTGSAASFQISRKEGEEPTFYVNIINQFSWDAAKRTGSFGGNRKDPDKNVNFKLNETELGEILHTINTNVTWSGYHKSQNNTTQIRFAPYKKRRGVKEGEPESGEEYLCFGFSVTKNGANRFKIPLEPGEYMRLVAFINKYFSVLDDYREKAWNEGANNAAPTPETQEVQESNVEF